MFVTADSRRKYTLQDETSPTVFMNGNGGSYLREPTTDEQRMIGTFRMVGAAIATKLCQSCRIVLHGLIG